MTRTPVGDRRHVHLYMDEKIFEGLARVAELRGTTASELIRMACRQYLIRESEKVAAEVAALKRVKP